MLERNCVTIDKRKSKEFKKLLSRSAKNKDFWKKNKEYLLSHKVDIEKLDALYSE